MTPERLAEIQQRHDIYVAHGHYPGNRDSVFRHRGELLAEVQRLTERVAELEARPTGYIEISEPLTKAEAEDLKRRFLEAQQTQPIRVITYPETDYPQELRDQHESWLPQIDAMLDAYKIPQDLRAAWRAINEGD